ncbi:cytochrome c biogenesis protein CcsA [Paenibacillus alvei]|uniref:Cytochrome c biogenesis protein CcsA n=1 Tax=Paenibacillus alvei TaxID=44250 RepID=A0ABT4GSW4_PAEAL|nr:MULTISPECIES: cytochrome c biogenesis protein CcsA [Paenibacillus]EJW18098.1 cytochrome c biogenesis protein ResC [Paenibacillus alvei DSM 29]MCY7487340.1 cytochrome c biogenesis protein CcsA [Paenibacillus alvei]MCY9542150.1 cytochrome c biogenesis protein CcsA [Paenibacillus alvei]MCY9703594.1 cytochrome c biogenesis protein CcsA [Paenibacillus alvei]MCY9732475.1 cytochrome c biogenesis protein CcsA [Paenibacillus alvei]
MTLQWSQDAYIIAFFLFCLSFILYVVTVAGRKMKTRDPVRFERRWGAISFGVTILGFISQIVYFGCRWAYAGHIPVSNMYEFMSFLSMMIIGAFIVVYLIYRSTVLGLLAVPLAFLMMAYASVFPSEVQPLIPQLNSVWLKLHVTMSALSYAFFAVAFVAGLLYLLRTVRWEEGSSRKPQRWLEFTMGCIVVFIGFIVVVYSFRAANYEVVIGQKVETVKTGGEIETGLEMVTYTMPPLIAPHMSDEATLKSVPSFLGMKLPLMEAPGWMKGVQAGRKLNTVVWSVIAGLILYGLIRLLLRKPIAKALQPLFNGIDPETVDEISYRSIAIGFPIFTLGALIFAMIWAQVAWSRFWGWDPKEVWALVTWLAYSAYLHLRLARSWQGTKSSWMSVIGFIIVMFTLVGVNLVISGLHSYSGV